MTAWVVGAVVRVGSREHYGWPESDYTVTGLHPGASSATEFLQVRRDDGPDTSLYLRRRFDELAWADAPTEEIQVGAWPGDALPDGEPFRPASRNPESWLYVTPGDGT